MLESGATAVAYETLSDSSGRLPLLTPMSEVAGRMSIQEGAKYLERPQMGRGILLGGVPGVAPAKVVILGGGVVGTNAAAMAMGLGLLPEYVPPYESEERDPDLVKRLPLTLISPPAIFLASCGCSAFSRCR